VASRTSCSEAAAPAGAASGSSAIGDLNISGSSYGQRRWVPTF
jgi:hypothetical protein